MHSYTGSSLFSAGKLLMEHGIASDILTPSNESNLPVTRNQIAANFLALGYTHLMCIDADIQFSPAAVIELLAMDKDFAAAPYRLKQEQVCYCDVPCDETTEDQVTQVRSVGVGFALLRRSLFDRLSSHVERVYSPVFRHMIHDYYSPITIHGQQPGEDAAFCYRWRQAGGEVWINRGIKLGHYGGFVYG
jgi:hypothetical protein